MINMSFLTRWGPPSHKVLWFHPVSRFHPINYSSLYIYHRLQACLAESPHSSNIFCVSHHIPMKNHHSCCFFHYHKFPLPLKKSNEIPKMLRMFIIFLWFFMVSYILQYFPVVFLWFSGGSTPCIPRRFLQRGPTSGGAVATAPCKLSR